METNQWYPDNAEGWFILGLFTLLFVALAILTRRKEK